MSISDLLYPFDPTGKASTNLVTGERQPISPSQNITDFYFILPKAGPFFRDSLKVTLYPGGQLLKEGVDFTCTHNFSAATHSIGLGIYGSITFYNHFLTGTVSLEYQTVGGDWTIDEAKIAQILANKLIDPRITNWEQVTDVPYQFPPINHEYSIDDWYGASEIVTELTNIKQAILDNGSGKLGEHIADKNNPHQVTKAQVGLSLVQNYTIAAPGEATAGTSNTLYMTPLRTKQLIDAYAIAAVNAHANRIDNPHQVTKAQVGLGSVENLPLATQQEAQLGASHARYMTPLRTKEAITALVLNDFNAWKARTDNPHGVTKAQVGLGNVENLLIATQEQAEDGAINTAYMTPLRTKQAIAAQVGATLSLHVNDKNNPHQTTKAQVGLSLVRNLPTATQAQAEEALSDDVYMTPLATRYAIQKLADASVGDHAGRTDNPHHVTAAQVGAYTTQVMDQKLQEKLGSNDTAANANKVYGLDQTELSAAILAGKAANSTLFDGRTMAQVTEAILVGKAADSGKLEGNTLAQVLDLAKQESEVKAAGQVYLATIIDGLTATYAYTKFAWVDPAELDAEDLAFTVSGGRADGALEPSLQLVSMTMRKDDDNLIIANQRRYITNLLGSGGPEIYAAPGLHPDTSEPILTFWTRDTAARGGVTITDLSSGKLNFYAQEEITDPAQLTLALPSGALAMVREKSLEETILQLVLLLDAQTATLNAWSI